MSPRRLRRVAKELSQRAFLLGDRAGIHVLPKHYYSSVPDHAWLRDHASLWQRRASLPGVRWNHDEQLARLEAICTDFYPEVRGLASYRRLASTSLGPGYGPIESQVLHCFLRATAPARVVEVGGGMSSAVIAEAVRRNAKDGRAASRIRTVEPWPSAALRALPGVELLPVRCEEAPPTLWQELGAGDLVFVDSSHAVKTGSEVPYIFLEVVPSLSPGVVVHVHDVTLPYLYSPSLLAGYLDPQETALVAALLTDNERLEVACCLSALHHDRPAELQAVLSDYRPQPMSAGLEAVPEGHFPSSLWLRTR